MLTQQQLLALVGSFNIIGSLNLKEIAENDTERKAKLTDRKAEEIQKFKTIWSALDPEQQTALDSLVEFKLTGTEFSSYSEFVSSI